MGYRIHVYTRDRITGERQPANDIRPFMPQWMGDRIWGHPLMKQVGLVFLPLIPVMSGVLVRNEELSQLESDLKLVEAHMDEIIKTLSLDKSRFQRDLKPLQEALELAKSVGGEISIV